MFASAMTWNFRTLSDARRALVVIGLYLAVLLALRGFLFPAGSADDAEQLLFAQTLAGGYSQTQPPLFTWLVVAATRVLGVGLPAVLAVKWLCLWGLFFFVHRAARRALGPGALAGLAAASLLGLYYIIWDAAFNYSNTLVLAVACAATFDAVLGLDRKAGIGSYVYLGLALGLGLVSKYSYPVFAVGLLAAMLWDADLRARLANVRIGLSLMVAAAIVLPHALWLAAGGGFDPAAVMAARLGAAPDQGYFAAAARGFVKLANALVSFPFPLFLLFALFFPRAWRRLPKTDGDGARDRRLMVRALLASLAIIAVGIAVFGVSSVRNHYLFMFAVFPIYFFLRVRAAGTDERALMRHGAALAILALIALAGLPVRQAYAPAWCGKCPFHMRYDVLAAGLGSAGFTRGTIVSHFHRLQIGANLRPWFPDSRVLSGKYPRYVPPPSALAAGQCLVIWDAALGVTAPPGALGVAKSLGARPGDRDIAGVIEAPLRHGGGRTFRLGYRLVRAGGACR